MNDARDIVHSCILKFWEKYHNANLQYPTYLDDLLLKSRAEQISRLVVIILSETINYLRKKQWERERFCSLSQEAYNVEPSFSEDFAERIDCNKMIEAINWIPNKRYRKIVQLLQNQTPKVIIKMEMGLSEVQYRNLKSRAIRQFHEVLSYLDIQVTLRTRRA